MDGESFVKSIPLPSGDLQSVRQMGPVQFILEAHKYFYNYNHDEAHLQSFMKGDTFMREKYWLL